MVSTRQFAQDEDVLVPLADHLNHAPVFVSMITCEEEALKGTEQEIDFRDFAGKRIAEEKPMPKRSYASRLDRYMKANPKTHIKVTNIWDVNRLVSEYKSSTDDEMHSSEEEADSSDEEEETAEPEAPGSYYYVLKTGARCSFKAGKQVFNCYGNYSNRQLLLCYGFALDSNPYDSLRVRVWKTAFRQKTGLVSVDDTLGKTYQEELASAKLSDVSQVFRLKRNKVNHSLLTYFRQLVIAELQTNPALVKSVASMLVASPTTEMVEIPVVTKVLQLLEEVERQRFITTIESDTSIDPNGLPPRHKFAVSARQLCYRISQKRILQGQRALMQRLLAILKKMEGGVELTEAHMSQGSVEDLYPLMSYLRSLQVNHARWLESKS